MNVLIWMTNVRITAELTAAFTLVKAKRQARSLPGIISLITGHSILKVKFKSTGHSNLIYSKDTTNESNITRLWVTT